MSQARARRFRYGSRAPAQIVAKLAIAHLSIMLYSVTSLHELDKTNRGSDSIISRDDRAAPRRIEIDHNAQRHWTVSGRLNERQSGVV
jgi:hypothetical protein